MDEGESGKRKQAPRMRLSQEKRDRFLELLGQTGNRRLAAEAIGVEPRLMDQRREFDPLLDRQWKEALDQAERRLSGASGPLDCIGGAEPMVVRRGSDGRMKVVKAGPRRWSGPVEDRFFAALSATGNIAAAARSVGFSLSTIAHRRRKWPDFARRLEEALEDAEVALEFRLAVSSGGWGGIEEAEPERPSILPSQEYEVAPDPAAGGSGDFDADLAMRFLKWREEKRRGGVRRGRGRMPPEPSIEEVRDTVLTRIAALRRHREREQLANGWSKDEEGRMIPPGWVREKPPE